MDSKTLTASAQRWMITGLEAFTRGTDLDFAVHHFGVASEHALKALLASYHPALVIDANDFHGLLHATGHGVLSKTPLAGAKTIQAITAFERCNELLRPLLPIKKEDFRTFLNARNGVSHLGVHEKDKAREHLITAIRIIDPLLSALSVEQESFWGRYKTLHDELLQKHADDLKLAYIAKIANAENVLAARLGPGVTAESLAQLRSEMFGLPGEEAPATCPACQAEGRLTGMFSVELDEDKPEGEEEWVVMLHPFQFQCIVCHLQLDRAEFDLAGLPEEVRTTEDPYDWGEPDEDLYRDR
ncbi:hypothetical protein [Streptomyces sp. NPDC090135]|uniref:hypothetical protein n=1 Tax=Streptomyces sp. NPDC090135 TaxID=3365957 RepID=UPI003824CD97